MKTVRLPSILLYLCVPLCMGALLTACDDATNVGEDLVGAQGGQPQISELHVEDLQAGDLIRPANLPPRVIAGTVVDPALGTYVVEGYFDLTPVSSEDFRAQPVEEVELRLRPSYVYGDSTSELTLALREITVDWDPAGLPTDTSFSVGPVIHEFSFFSTDTLVVVPLPESWVEDHVDAFRSTDFGDLFHGFRLDPVAGNAVVGFGPGSTNLFAATADESLSMPIGVSYPSVKRTTTVELPPDRFLMQAGAGPTLSFSLLEEGEELESISVNRFTLTFWVDTVAVTDAMPEHFVRPTLQTLDLHGVTSDGSLELLARSTVTTAGQVVFDTRALSRAIQDALVGSPRYERYEIVIPDPNTFASGQGEALFYYTSLNPIVFFDTGAGDKTPNGFLTFTPLD